MIPDEVLDDPFGEAECGEHDEADRRKDQGSIEREIQVEQALPEHGVGDERRSCQAGGSGGGYGPQEIDRLARRDEQEEQGKRSQVGAKRHQDDLDPVARASVVLPIVPGDASKKEHSCQEDTRDEQRVAKGRSRECRDLPTDGGHCQQRGRRAENLLLSRADTFSGKLEAGQWQEQADARGRDDAQGDL